MNVEIAYCITGLSMFSFPMIWFICTYQVLIRKRDAVYKAQEVMQLHADGYEGIRGSPDESTARHILDTSIQIYEQIRTTYNTTLEKPLYRFTGFLLGFKRIIT